MGTLANHLVQRFGDLNVSISNRDCFYFHVFFHCQCLNFKDLPPWSKQNILFLKTALCSSPPLLPALEKSTSQVPKGKKSRRGCSELQGGRTSRSSRARVVPRAAQPRLSVPLCPGNDAKIHLRFEVAFLSRLAWLNVHSWDSCRFLIMPAGQSCEWVHHQTTFLQILLNLVFSEYAAWPGSGLWWWWFSVP